MNFYQILGVSVTATTKDIQQAYRKLAKLYHPDVNPDNIRVEELFKKINTAYETLSDERKRKLYDAKLSQANAQGQRRQGAHSTYSRQRTQRRTSSGVDYEQFLNHYRERIAKRHIKMNNWTDVLGFVAVLLDEHIKSKK